jgi:hypothetical protein
MISRILIAIIASTLLFSMGALGGGGAKKIDEPPRKRCTEAELLFGVVEETPQPPRKRWAGPHAYENEDSDESAEEVITQHTTKSRTQTDEAPIKTNLYVTNLMAEAKGGNLEAMFKLADLLFKGREGLEVDEQQGLALLVAAAEKGYLKAQELLGRAYEYGLYGLQADDAQAAEWYQRAINNGRGLKRAREGLQRVMQRQVPATATTVAQAPVPTPPPAPTLIRQVVRDPSRPYVLVLRTVQALQGSGKQ